MSILGLALITSLDSCGDVEGCIDIEAENYNPDADVSDGSCTYARDKFLGVYIGDLACEAPLSNQGEFTVTISEGLTDNSEVLISFQDVTTPLPELTARVDGDQLIIDPESADVPLDPSMPTILTTVTYSGEVVIDENEENLSGELRVVFTIVIPLEAKCDLTAVKQ